MTAALTRAPGDPPPDCPRKPRDVIGDHGRMTRIGTGVLPDVGHVEWWQCCRSLCGHIDRYVLVATEEPSLFEDGAA
jgi:hypothetical protein